MCFVHCQKFSNFYVPGPFTVILFLFFLKPLPEFSLANAADAGFDVGPQTKIGHQLAITDDWCTFSAECQRNQLLGF